jgi:hypothetical protein
MKTIEKKKPVLVDGYAESLNFIAMASNSVSRHKPKAVMFEPDTIVSVTPNKLIEFPEIILFTPKTLTLLPSTTLLTPTTKDDSPETVLPDPVENEFAEYTILPVPKAIEED